MGEDMNEADEALTLPPLGFAFLQDSQPLLLKTERRKDPGTAVVLPPWGRPASEHA